MREPERVLDQLEAVITDRAARPRENSYTSKLLTGGVDAIGAKIMEEAAELVKAAETDAGGRQHFLHEAADLVYHLLVMLRHQGVRLSDVEAELAKRFGVSGMEEKESRQEKRPQ